MQVQAQAFNPNPPVPTPVQAPPVANVPPPPVVPPPPPPPQPIPATAPTPEPAPAPELAPAPDTSAEQPDTTPVMAPMMLLYAVAAFAYNIAFKKAATDIQSSPDGNGLFLFNQTVNQPSQVSGKSEQDKRVMTLGSTMNKVAMDAAMSLEGVTEDQADQMREEMQVTQDDLPD